MRIAAALSMGLLALALAQPAAAQDQQTEPERAPAQRIQEAMQQDFDPRSLQLARRVIAATEMSREFDSILPDVAEEAKTTLIRSNPQLQLGIIEVVDRVALQMVDRRAELDEVFARIWASAFTDEELQQLLDFYESSVGKKYAQRLPRVLAVQIGMAQQWRQSLAQQLYRNVQQELQTMAESEAMQLQGAAPQQGGGTAAQ